jgi:LmbE family N-acetylglucosaminyl deacetylase
MMNSNRILILAPHTDDGELGCGGTIAKYIAAGKEVTYLALSSCSQSLPPGFSPDTLVTECKAATKVLGLQNLRFLDFEVRQLLFHRQEILEALLAISQEIKPQTVLLPAEHDVHQDHQVVYAEGMRAFKNCNILGYELPWNNFRFCPSYFETINEEELQLKQKALQQYRSQSHKKYMDPGFTRSLAVVRGVQANNSLAEAFEVYHLVG